MAADGTPRLQRDGRLARGGYGASQSGRGALSKAEEGLNRFERATAIVHAGVTFRPKKWQDPPLLIGGG
jgi:hypothetical protein